MALAKFCLECGEIFDENEECSCLRLEGASVDMQIVSNELSREIAAEVEKHVQECGDRIRTEMDERFQNASARKFEVPEKHQRAVERSLALGKAAAGPDPEHCCKTCYRCLYCGGRRGKHNSGCDRPGQGSSRQTMWFYYGSFAIVLLYGVIQLLKGLWPS